MAIQIPESPFEPALGKTGGLPFHAQSIERCLAELETSLQGLSEEEVKARLKFAREQTSALSTRRADQLLGKAFQHTASCLFLAAAGTSLYLGRPMEGLLILIAMLVNAAMQNVIRWQALRPQTPLLDMDSLRCPVRRDGQLHMVAASELVPGDILLIESGQLIPADARLLSSYQLQVDESLLTGESVLVPKNANAMLHAAEEVSAQCNMLFAGTFVKTGKGEAVVTALGDKSIMGKVSLLARGAERRESDLARRLNALSQRSFLAVLLLSCVLVAVGLQQGTPLPALIQAALMMTIATLPKTIPALAGLILSMSVGRLNEKKVLVKNFQALENLADINIVCSDKTGTLTENYLSLERMFLPGLGAVPYESQWNTEKSLPHRSLEELLRIGRLNNGTVLEGLRSPLMGDPIDVALYRAAPAWLEVGYHRRLNIPFDPVALRSAVICETADGEMVSLIKGAPEAVLETCIAYLKPDGTTVEISLAQRSEFLLHNRKLAYENNSRVIGFARKVMTDNHPYENAVFVGWACLQDPPKPGVTETIRRLQDLGAEVIMITGDQKATAEMTAWELGIMRRKSDEVWLRSDLDAWEGPKIPASVRVFARTKPEEKLAIVESLQKSGNRVAMLGDGVNDSPALQKSDVAIAMGLQGAEAAKDSADIILLNDRLEGLIDAMQESALLRSKIRTCLYYLLSCNFSLIAFIAAALAAGLGLPIGMVPLLWLNLVVVSMSSLALAIEPPKLDETTFSGEHSGIRPLSSASPKQPSLATKNALLTGMHLAMLLYWALITAGAALGAYYLCTLVLKLSATVASSAAFLALAVAQTGNMFNVQAFQAGTDRKTFLAELSSMPITWIVIAVTLFLQGVVLYVPGVHALMGLSSLSPEAALIALACGVGAVLLTLNTTKTEMDGQDA